MGFRQPIKVWRYTDKPQLQANGKFVMPEPEAITIMASVQPLKITEMDALPEGRRGAHAVKTYSDEPFLMADQDTGQQADRFEWLGRTYEIVGTDAFQCNVISHYRCYAVEVKKH